MNYFVGKSLLTKSLHVKQKMEWNSEILYELIL